MNTHIDRVVVGASAAGLTAAETLRHQGFSGDLTLVGAESHLPYDRPPLSKQVLDGRWTRERAFLRKDAALEALNARWLLGTAARQLDRASCRVLLSDGTTLGYDGLVIATGVAARRLSGDDLVGVQYDVKIQVYGVPDSCAECHIVRGDPAEGRFAAAYQRGGRSVAMLTWNMPRAALELREQLIAESDAPVTTTAAPR
jgi:NADPH-dependent 2,4-dienoyl-CoA reductase/sulfur reductase-like enzyme